jgi:glycosyltransferase involved in cell wall biosynthesis
MGELKVTAIVATQNSAAQLRPTLESLVSQDHDGLEIVAVDSGSTDKTLPSCSRVEAYNRGAAIATGDYLLFLPPGALLFRPSGIRELVAMAGVTDYPDLLYGGYSLRLADGSTEVVALPLSEQRLRRGQTPVHPCASLWRASTFLRLGKFDPYFSYQGAHDLASRLVRHPNATYLRVTWVVSEYERPKETYGQLMQRHREMFHSLHRNWGLRTALQWFLGGNMLETARWWWGRFRERILGPEAIRHQ